jgi:hypothetical protein
VNRTYCYCNATVSTNSHLLRGAHSTIHRSVIRRPYHLLRKSKRTFVGERKEAGAGPDTDPCLGLLTVCLRLCHKVVIDTGFNGCLISTSSGVASLTSMPFSGRPSPCGDVQYCDRSADSVNSYAGTDSFGTWTSGQAVCADGQGGNHH